MRNVRNKETKNGERGVGGNAFNYIKTSIIKFKTLNSLFLSQTTQVYKKEEE